MKLALATLLLALAPLAHAAEAQLLQADELLRHGEFTKARAMFSALAAKGDAEAMHQLGLDYAKGRGGIAVDNAKAMQWFSSAAMRGNARAMTKLGLMHLEGRGTVKNPTAAMRWLQLAAEREEPHAHYLLSNAYFMGEHVPKDLQQAYIHMALAQRYKHPAAMGRADHLAKLLTARERSEAEEEIDKRTPEDFRRQMKEVPARASAPSLQRR